MVYAPDGFKFVYIKARRCSSTWRPWLEECRQCTLRRRQRLRHFGGIGIGWAPSSWLRHLPKEKASTEVGSVRRDKCWDGDARSLPSLAKPRISRVQRIMSPKKNKIDRRTLAGAGSGGIGGGGRRQRPGTGMPMWPITRSAMSIRWACIGHVTACPAPFRAHGKPSRPKSILLEIFPATTR